MDFEVTPPLTIKVTSPTLRDLVATAYAAHRVNSPLPKFFNPLFRNQANVNRRVLEVLSRIRETVDILISKIGSSEPILSTLLCNQSEHTRRIQEVQTRQERLESSNSNVLQLAEALTSNQRASDLRIATLAETIRTELFAEMRKHEENLTAHSLRLTKIETAVATLQCTYDTEKIKLSQFDDAQKAARNHIKTHSLRLNDIETATAKLRIELDTERTKLSEVGNIHQASTTQLAKELEATRAKLSQMTPASLPAAIEQRNAVAEARSSVRQLQAAVDEIRAFREQHQSARSCMAQMAAKIDDLQKFVQTSPRQLPDDDNTSGFNDFYQAFENSFRGTRESVLERGEKYVLPITTAINRTQLKNLDNVSDSPLVLDLGCGRGEWLELLMHREIAARGVDINTVFLKACRLTGFDVIEGDAVAYLATLKSESLAGVTAFHLIEHLPYPETMRLIREAYRVLATGGLLILETPNPDNLRVAAVDFYLDPTHRHPLPAPLVEFTAQQAGFSHVRIQPAHPYPDSYFLPATDELSRRWNETFYSARDYAIIAEK